MPDLYCIVFMPCSIHAFAELHRYLNESYSLIYCITIRNASGRVIYIFGMSSFQGIILIACYVLFEKSMAME